MRRDGKVAVIVAAGSVLWCAEPSVGVRAQVPDPHHLSVAILILLQGGVGDEVSAAAVHDGNAVLLAVGNRHGVQPAHYQLAGRVQMAVGGFHVVKARLGHAERARPFLLQAGRRVGVEVDRRFQHGPVGTMFFQFVQTEPAGLGGSQSDGVEAQGGPADVAARDGEAVFLLRIKRSFNRPRDFGILIFANQVIQGLDARIALVAGYGAAQGVGQGRNIGCRTAEGESQISLHVFRHVAIVLRPLAQQLEGLGGAGIVVVDGVESDQQRCSALPLPGKILRQLVTDTAGLLVVADVAQAYHYGLGHGR